jgi:hypothetical protein
MIWLRRVVAIRAVTVKLVAMAQNFEAILDGNLLLGVFDEF